MPSTNAPANPPAPTVSVVESSRTTPEEAPSSAASVTAALNKFRLPSAVNVAPAASLPPSSTFNAAPDATPMVSVAIVPVPVTVADPAFTARAPLKVLEPERTSAPCPDFVNPADPTIEPATSTSLRKVTALSPLKDIIPESVSLPESVVPPTTRSPPSRIEFAIKRSLTESLESAPLVKLRVPNPKAASFPSLIVPPLRTTPPANVLAPLRVKMLLPVLSSAPEPETVPVKEVLKEPASVSVPAARFTIPAPAIEETDSFARTFKRAASFTTTSTPSASAAPPDNESVPPATVTTPNAVFAPARVSSAAPVFTQSKSPESTPLMITGLSMAKVRPPVSVAFPASVRVPMCALLPKATLPSRESGLESVLAVAPSLARRPPINASVPSPSAASLPIKIDPAFKVTPAANVFTPESVNAPLPVFISEPAAPEITPLKFESETPLTVSAEDCNSTAPAPSKVAISSEEANRSFPLSPTVTAILSTRAAPPDKVRVPEDTSVDPVKVFAPDSVNSAPPSFTKP